MAKIVLLLLTILWLPLESVVRAASEGGTPVASPGVLVSFGDPEFVRLGDGWLLSVSPTGESALVSRSGEGVCFVALQETREDVCQFDMPRNYGEAQWSRDGKRVVFATDRSLSYGEDSDIWIMDRHSASLTNLTDDGYLFEPQYTSTPTCGICPPDTPADVQNRLAAQMGPGYIDARFPPGTPVDLTPVFTPDGNTVIFSRSWANDDQKLFGTDLMLIKVDGGEPTDLKTVSQEPLATLLGITVVGKSEVAFGLTSLTDASEDSGLWLFDWENKELSLIRKDDRGWLHTSRPMAKFAESFILVSFPFLIGGEAITHTCAYWLFDQTTESLSTLKAESKCPVAAFVSPDGRTLIVVYMEALGIFDPAVPGVQVLEVAAVRQLISSQNGWFLTPMSWSADGYLNFRTLAGDLARVPVENSEASSESP